MLFYICVCACVCVCVHLCVLWDRAHACGSQRWMLGFLFKSSCLVFVCYGSFFLLFFHDFLYVYEKCILIIFPIIFSYPFSEPLPNKAPSYFHVTRLCMCVCKHSCVHVLFLPQQTPLGSWDKDSHWLTDGERVTGSKPSSLCLPAHLRVSTSV